MIENELNVSIVIPLYNEEESLPELFSWIQKVLSEARLSYELILVDDGSTDKSWQVIQSLAAEHKEIKAIQFQRNFLLNEVIIS